MLAMDSLGGDITDFSLFFLFHPAIFLSYFCLSVFYIFFTMSLDYLIVKKVIKNVSYQNKRRHARSRVWLC